MRPTPFVDALPSHTHADLVHTRHPHDDCPRRAQPMDRSTVARRRPLVLSEKLGTLRVVVTPDIERVLDSDWDAVERPKRLI